MKLKHKAGHEDWAGVELPDEPGALVASIPGVTPKDKGGAVDWGKCAHLVVMGIKEEQNRIVTNARRTAVAAKLEPDAVEKAAATALMDYEPGITYKAKPSVLDAALDTLRKAGVPMTKVALAATEGMDEANLMKLKANMVAKGRQ